VDEGPDLGAPHQSGIGIDTVSGEKAGEIGDAAGHYFDGFPAFALGCRAELVTLEQGHDIVTVF